MQIVGMDIQKSVRRQISARHLMILDILRQM